MNDLYDLKELSLRDYFAANALAAIIAACGRSEVDDVVNEMRAGLLEAKAAYSYADAMLKARSK